MCDLEFQGQPSRSHNFSNIFDIHDLENVRIDIKINFVSCLQPEMTKVTQKNICSNEGRAALASCFSTDPVQGYSHDVEVCRWVRAGLSARSLPPTVHNLRPSTNAILRGKSFPARSSTGQNCDNAEKGFRLCRSDPVEQYA